jgi:hypothetical protein
MDDKFRELIERMPSVNSKKCTEIAMSITAIIEQNKVNLIEYGVIMDILRQVEDLKMRLIWDKMNGRGGQI